MPLIGYITVILAIAIPMYALLFTHFLIRTRKHYSQHMVKMLCLFCIGIFSGMVILYLMIAYVPHQFLVF